MDATRAIACCCAREGLLQVASAELLRSCTGSAAWLRFNQLSRLLVAGGEKRQGGGCSRSQGAHQATPLQGR